MPSFNQSELSEFILIGFPGLQQKFHPLASVTVFLVYVMSLMANGTVIFLVIMKKHLHQSMYVIILNLSLSDLLFDTITLPKVTAMYWFGDGRISFICCMAQLFCVHLLGSLDSFVIMLMAIDRYVAIINPLRYPSMITNKLVVVVCLFLWFVAALFVAPSFVSTFQLPFCQQYPKIYNCFCSVSNLLPLACVDTTLTRRIAGVSALTVLLGPLIFIILSYVIIIRTICSSIRYEKWRKAFYTCSKHLIIITLYYIPRIFVYIANQARLLLDTDLTVVLQCLYTFVPHLINPIIYCLWTKEIKRTLMGSVSVLRDRFIAAVTRVTVQRPCFSA
ncbi:olfactory receptor 10G8-like [Pelodytes ibericus]